MQMEIESRCPICRDFYDDAVLVRDGFAYCRLCILQWAGYGHKDWRSPRTNECIGGHPVLRTDVERNCAAKALRKKELLEIQNLQDEECILRALDATHCGAPLLEKSDCDQFLWHPVILSSPYAHLAIAYRAGSVESLPSQIIHEVCRLDRRAVMVPLLDMEIVATLLREAVRRCALFDDDDVMLLKRVKEHFHWRGKARDAIEVPAERTALEKLVGFYYRDWISVDHNSVVFIKGRGVRDARYHLRVPLVSDQTRGSCELPFRTCVFADASFSKTPDECPLLTAYSSEVPLKRDASYWRARRGGLPFPDSRGAEDTEDEDWEEKMPEGCAAIFEKTLHHLPHGFVYHRRRDDDDHFFELMTELNMANEALLSANEKLEVCDRVGKRQKME
jgi:hypothetical protein